MPLSLRTFSLAILAVAMASVPAGAQGCPQGQVALAVTPANPVPSGTVLQATVTGTPGAALWLFHSASSGQTTLPGPGPLSGTVLCLGTPLTKRPLGPLPPSGTKTVPVPTPPGAPAGATLHYQAVEIAPASSGAIVDTSNAVSVLFGGPPPCTPGSVQLTITPSNPAPGTPLAVSVTGTPGAFALLFRSDSQGSAIVPPHGPFAGEVICLDAPFRQRPLGPIPVSGTLAVQIPTPPGPAGATLYYQAGTVAPAPTGATRDTSNVVAITRPQPPPCVPGNVLLDIQPDTPVLPGSTITIGVTGTAGSLVLLASGPNLGSTTLPLGNLALCLGWPWHVRVLGMTSAAGTLSETHNVPPNAMLPPNLTVYFQAVEISAASSALAFDISNLDTLTF